MTDLPLHDHLDRLLDRWVAEGLIDPAQAARIKAAEAVRTPTPTPTATATATATATPTPTARATGASHRSLVVEALGYLGGALAVIAGFLAVAQLWPDITTGAEIVLAALGVLVLLGAGAAVRPSNDAALGRLRSVLWLLSAACLAVLMELVVGRVGEWRGEHTALVAATATTGYGLVLWRRTQSVLQHLTVFAGLTTAVAAAIAAVDTGSDPWAPGLGVWLVSALWAVATRRGIVEPGPAGLVFAAIGLVIGSLLTMSEAAGHVLALVTLVVLVVAGVRLRAIWLVAIGAFDVVLTVPQTASRYLPESAAAPIAIFAVGLTLLGTAIWLAKHGGEHDPEAEAEPESGPGL